MGHFGGACIEILETIEDRKTVEWVKFLTILLQI